MWNILKVLLLPFFFVYVIIKDLLKALGITQIILLIPFMLFAYGAINAGLEWYYWLPGALLAYSVMYSGVDLISRITTRPATTASHQRHRQ